MILNTATERVYVGATAQTLDDRWSNHLSETIRTESRFGNALKEWEETFWLPVVLCNCYSAEELGKAERAWQQITSCFDGAVGYNERIGRYEATHKTSNPLTTGGKKGSPLEGLTVEERREFFREAGRRGAAKSRSLKR